MKLMKLEKWDEPLGFSRNVAAKSPILRHALARFAGHRPPTGQVSTRFHEGP